MSSLEDAIDYTNSSARQSQHPALPLLASYIFATPKTAKYLSQFISSSASFINTIPAGLLIGPAAPYAPQQPLNIEYRYTPTMFSACSPQLVHPPPSSVQIAHVLFVQDSKSSSKEDSLTARQLADLSIQPLKPTGQPLQHARVGFFEQGIMIGLGFAATPILLSLGTGVFFGLRFMWQRFH
jgi:hypothetical protein